MIRILEALQKGRGEIADVLPQVLREEQGGTAGQPIPEDSTDAAVHAVLGDRGPVQALPVVKAAPATRQRTFRQAALHISASLPLLPFDHTNALAAEQYRIIRTKLIQHPKQPRIIMISSAGPSDGKSVTAVNTAGALSLKNEADVLLLDGDLRRSTIHKQLGLPASPGLSEVLNGTVTLEEALVQVTQLPNLFVLPGGEPQANPSELLDSARWTALCSRMQSLFRYVIVDSPPVASVADYDLLQASCDGIVLVARPDHTNRMACLRVFELVPKEKLIGVVMNCVPNWFLGRSQYYGAYSGYSYGA
jgi:receptor protein-tyrosine kinase